jgi:hypothetical protein
MLPAISGSLVINQAIKKVSAVPVILHVMAFAALLALVACN